MTLVTNDVNNKKALTLDLLLFLSLNFYFSMDIIDCTDIKKYLHKELLRTVLGLQQTATHEPDKCDLHTRDGGYSTILLVACDHASRTLCSSFLISVLLAT